MPLVRRIRSRKVESREHTQISNRFRRRPIKSSCAHLCLLQVVKAIPLFQVPAPDLHREWMGIISFTSSSCCFFLSQSLRYLHRDRPNKNRLGVNWHRISLLNHSHHLFVLVLDRCDLSSCPMIANCIVSACSESSCGVAHSRCRDCNCGGTMKHLKWLRSWSLRC